MLQVHPDKNPGESALATTAFQFLQEAHKAMKQAGAAFAGGFM